MSSSAALWAAFGGLLVVCGGRESLLRVMIEPGFRTGRALARLRPRTGEHFRAEVRYLRAAYRCWRSNY